eukprot:COSAG02_NODE_720_length_18054_cov_23.121192_9_plen_51_part_00
MAGDDKPHGNTAETIYPGLGTRGFSRLGDTIGISLPPVDSIDGRVPEVLH